MSEQMHEEFEAWVKSLSPNRYLSTERFSPLHGVTEGEYKGFTVQCCWESFQAARKTGFTAVDMGTASADGFRDGIAKLNAAYLAGWSASGQGWNGEHPCGACERETWAKDRDADIQKIIAADVSKEG